MKHTRTWLDLYGSACASFEGRAGGHSWLVASPVQWASRLPAQLEALDGKGQVDLLIHDGLTPLETTLKALKPRGVVVIADTDLAGGPKTEVEARVVSEGGVDYTEGGSYPAWQSAFAGPQAKATGENAAASATALAGFEVIVITADQVKTKLERWMNTVPHGR